MNRPLQIFQNQRAARWVVGLCVAGCVAAADPATTTNAPAITDLAGTNTTTLTTNIITLATNQIPLSIFIKPTKAKPVGRNPFFPDASMDDDAPAANTNAPVAETPQNLELTLMGISGSTEKRLAIVNDVTMAKGDTSSIHSGTINIIVHCLDVTTNSVVIEIGSERRELRMRKNQ